MWAVYINRLKQFFTTTANKSITCRGTCYLELLPLSYSELQNAKLASDNIHQHIIAGDILRFGTSSQTFLSGWVDMYKLNCKEM